LCRRAQLIGLFSIGFGLIIIAICRLPIYGGGTSQVNRNTLGSVEGFFAAFVANVPTLVTLRHPPSMNDTGRSASSSTYGYGSRSVGASSSRRQRGTRSGRDVESKHDASMAENTIVVTKDFEMVAHQRLGTGNASSEQERGPQDSVEELINEMSDPKRLNPGGKGR
jgi:hypothetical protein